MFEHLFEKFFICLKFSFKMFLKVLEYGNFQKYSILLFFNCLAIQYECFVIVESLLILTFDEWGS